MANSPYRIQYGRNNGPLESGSRGFANKTAAIKGAQSAAKSAKYGYGVWEMHYGRPGEYPKPVKIATVDENGKVTRLNPAVRKRPNPLGGWIAAGTTFAKSHVGANGTKPTPGDIRDGFESAWNASGEGWDDSTGGRYRRGWLNFKKGAGKVRGKRANPSTVDPETVRWFYAKGHRLGAENGPVGRSAERARFTELFKMSGLPVAAKTKAGVQFERGFDAGVQEFYKRGNPAPAAAAMFEAWTGTPSEHETVVVEKVFDHGHLADLARLVAFKLRGVRGQLKFTDPATRLCVNEAGTQLYIRGGDQGINLDDFNRVVTSPARRVDSTKESVVLGEITNLYYAARKPFLGGEHKKVGVYDHKLGGKSRNFPTLVYDTRSQLLSISGGVYYIKPDDYDGKHSRGIVD